MSAFFINVLTTLAPLASSAGAVALNPVPEEYRDNLEDAKDSYSDLFGSTAKNLRDNDELIPLNMPKTDQAVSEGIGFAGLIYGHSNTPESQKHFWQVYKARKNHFLKENGVMAWLVAPNGRIMESPSASDADQDWIAAELIALKKIKSGEWNPPANIPGFTQASFEAEIQKDLNAFWEKHTHTDAKTGRILFLAADSGYLRNVARESAGQYTYYPNYADPYFLTMFAKFDPNPSHQWSKLAQDILDLDQAIVKEELEYNPEALTIPKEKFTIDNPKIKRKFGATGQNPMPARVFVTVKGDGSFLVEKFAKQEPRKDEYDSIRFYVRMARTALLSGDPETKAKAVAILKDLLALAHIDSSDPRFAFIGKTTKNWGYNNTLARACFGIALYATEDLNARFFMKSLLNDFQWQEIDPQKELDASFFGESSKSSQNYYDQSLVLQALDLLFSKEIPWPMAPDNTDVLMGSDFIDQIRDFSDAKTDQEEEIIGNTNIKIPEKDFISWLIGLQREGADSAQVISLQLQSGVTNWNNRTKECQEHDSWCLLPLVDKWYSRAYWRADVPFILINNLETPEEAEKILTAFLSKPPFSLKVIFPSGSSLEERKKILLDALRDTLLKQANEPLLWGEYYFQKALIAKNKGEDPSPYFAKAALMFDAVIKNRKITKEEAQAAGFSPEEIKALPTATVMDSLIKFCGGADNKASATREAQKLYDTEKLPSALMYQAQIILIQAEDDEEELARAEDLLKEAESRLKGLLDKKSFGGDIWEALVKKGYITEEGQVTSTLKRRKDFTLDLTGVSRKEEKEIYQLLITARKAQRQTLRRAFPLLEIKRFKAEIDIRRQEADAPLETLEKIETWGAEYKKHIDKAETKGDVPCLWAKQIVGSSHSWLAKAYILKASKTADIETRIKLLEDSTAKLSTAIELLIGEAKIEAEAALLESRAMLAFARKEAGAANWPEEVEEVKSNLIKYRDSVKTENRLLVATLNHWIATALLVEADTKVALPEKKQVLKEAEEYVAATFKEIDKVTFESKANAKDSLRASAHKILGDILAAQKEFEAAKKEYQTALALFQGIHDRNIEKAKGKTYAARAQKREDTKLTLNTLEIKASLADLLNWTGQYEEAAAQYQKVISAYDPRTTDAETDAEVVRYQNISHASALRRANLGIAEATLRRTKGDYTDIQTYAQGIIKEILENEAPGNVLTSRALRFLLEGYSTKKIWQDHVIYLANQVLGTKYEMDKGEPPEEFKKLVKNINPSALDEKEKGKIYLYLVRALITQKRFKEAKELLAKLEFKHDILIAEYKLVKALAALRELQEDEKHEIPKEAYALIKEAAEFIFASDEFKKESFLVTEAASLLIEAALVEEKFEVAIKLVRHFLGEEPASSVTIEEKNASRKLTLTFDNDPANFKLVFKNTQDEELFKFDLELYRVDAIMLDKEFEAALKRIEELKKTYPDLREQTQLMVREADVRRYGKGGVKDLDKAIELYEQILAFSKKGNLPQTDTTLRVVGRAFLGLAKAQQEASRPLEAKENIRQAMQFKDYLDSAGEAKRAYAAIHDPLVASETRVFGSGNKQNKTHAEVQQNLRVNLFSYRDRVSVGLRNQTDFSEGLCRDTPYLTAKLQPINWFSLQTEWKLWQASGGDGTFDYFRNPSFIITPGIWTRWFDFLYSYSGYFEEENRENFDSHYLSAFVKPAGFIKWRWLQAISPEIGLEVNRYHFMLANSLQEETESPFHKEFDRNIPLRWNLTPMLRLNLDSGVFSDKYDLFKVRLYGGGIFNYIASEEERKALKKANYWGWRVGTGLTVSPAGWPSFLLDFDYQRDEYFTQWLLTFNINFAPLIFRSDGQSVDVYDLLFKRSASGPDDPMYDLHQELRNERFWR